MKQMTHQNYFVGPVAVMALVAGYMFLSAGVNIAFAKEAKLDPAAKAEVESTLRLHIGQSRTNISGLLTQMKDLEKDIEQQEKDIGLLFKAKNKPGLLQNIKDKTKKLKDKFIK